MRDIVTGCISRDTTKDKANRGRHYGSSGEERALLSREISRRQARLILGRLLKCRSEGGSLLSVRIPATAANRELLRALRVAELAAWRATDLPEGAGHSQQVE